ncbi:MULTISPECIES: hypothetical protein [Mameliella]|nr:MULTISPECIES: hypothetical protein [Mameliella]MCR9275635.1 hypothetical protein [Paracoccaceae bacterium]
MFAIFGIRHMVAPGHGRAIGNAVARLTGRRIRSLPLANTISPDS